MNDIEEILRRSCSARHGIPTQRDRPSPCFSSSPSLFVNRLENELHSRYLFSPGPFHSACGLLERLPLIQNVCRPGVVSIL
jgi:hypothetical protein